MTSSVLVAMSGVDSAVATLLLKQAGHDVVGATMCNRFLKFGSLLEKALALGFDRFASGHYAGIETRDDGHRLTRGSDVAKDQSYFLYVIPRHRLEKVLFPLAGLTKGAVRLLAAQAGLAISQKPESQDLCFAGGGRHRDLLERRRANSAPGPIVDMSGRVLGRHPGRRSFSTRPPPWPGVGPSGDHHGLVSSGKNFLVHSGQMPWVNRASE